MGITLSDKDMPADRPRDESGRAYHIGLREGDIPDVVLMPGDPDRVNRIVESWDAGEIIGQHREYRAARGRVGTSELGALSHGIGAGSTAIAVEELAEIGVRRFLRVGSSGSIQPDVDTGDLVIAVGAVRMEGVSDQYVPDGYPAVADPRMVHALIAACQELGYPFHVGITASSASFHLGQGRPGYGGYFPSRARHLVDDLRQARVINFDMETATVFTLASAFGLVAGSICAVYANRSTNRFSQDGMERCIAAANRAVVIYDAWERERRERGLSYFIPHP